MKKLLILPIAVFGIFLSVTLADTARAQVPGSIISVSGMFGAQSSSQTGVGTGYYYAVRGSFTTLFAEVRHVDWGSTGAYVRENGVLAGVDFSLFHIMLSGAVGFGASTNQGPASAANVSTNISSYSSLDYEAQAQYQFEIVAGAVTLGVGVNFVGEANNVAPITGLGGVASVSVGL